MAVGRVVAAGSLTLECPRRTDPRSVRDVAFVLGAFEEKNPRNSEVAYLTCVFVPASRGEHTTDLLQIIYFLPSTDGDRLVSATSIEGDQGTKKGVQR